MSLPHSLDLRMLESLVALVEEASVSKASERIAITQPRMSNLLARLRSVTGDPLLVRSGQRFVPTDRALEIAAGVRDSLATLHGALSRPVDFDPRTSTRSFVLTMSDYLVTELLPGIMVRLEQFAPRVELRIKSIEPQEVVHWLDLDECHLAFGVLPHLNVRLRASVLFVDAAVCIARAGRPDLPGRITTKQYLQSGHIKTSGMPVPLSTLEQIIDATLAENGHARRIAATTGTGLALATTVAQTDLIATLPARAAATFAAALPLQILDLPFRVTPFDITMAWHERVHRDPGHVWLRTLVRKAVTRG
jgi:LysR family transcriptional regulator, mexEF-oprN operon transcriptional activator